MKFQKIAFVVAGLMVSGLVGCGIPEEQYNADMDKMREKLASANDENGDLQNRLSGMNAEREVMQAELAELQRQLELLSQERDANAAEVAKAKERIDLFKQMLLSFRKLAEAGKIKIKIVNNKMVVEMDSAILFPSGSAKLSKEGKEALTQVAKVLSGIENRNFQVAGHTDNKAISSSKFKSNWELSSARAVSVVRHLIDGGMPADAISAAGYSDTQPASSNETAAGRAINRRIEIVLQPNLDELPDLSSLETMVD